MKGGGGGGGGKQNEREREKEREIKLGDDFFRYRRGFKTRENRSKGKEYLSKALAQ